MKQILLLEDDEGLNRGISLKLEKEGATFEELEYLTLGSLRKAVMEGDVVNGTLMAGQCAGMVTKEQTCRQIIQEIIQEASALLNK